VKVRSNLPAIQMEEATPLTMATEGVLAPEEVKAKKKGQFKGKSERSKEDKTRERRQKKSEKRRKAAEKVSAWTFMSRWQDFRTHILQYISTVKDKCWRTSVCHVWC